MAVGFFEFKWVISESEEMMSIQPDTYRVIRSKRKTISIEVTNEEEILVRAPRWVSMRDIRYFVDEKEAWIRKAKARVKAAKEKEAAEPNVKLTEEELQTLHDEARRIIPDRVAHYAPLIGVTYGRITIRHQKTRWGSCTAKGNLNFNCLLMLAPPEVLDAIVVHELCHRKVMNHSEKFYREIYRVFPEYDHWNTWLRKHGRELLRRNPG